MKVIICGAGKTGQTLAKYLGHSDNEIVVVDTDASVLKEMSALMDIQTIVGNSSHPDVLEQSDAHNADMIIAMTNNDEVNILTCYMAHNIYKIGTKIARTSVQSFLDEKYITKVSRNNTAISKIISPETEVARAVLRSLSAEWATEMISIGDDKMRFIGVECDENFIFTNTTPRQINRLLPGINLRIVMVLRDEKPVFIGLDDKIILGDEVYFAIPVSQIAIALEKMNIAMDLNRNILIVGGGRIGLNLIKLIEASNLFKNVRIVEKDEARAKMLAENVQDISITCGDILDDTIQEEIGLNNADIVISLMQEELNIISSLIAKNKSSAITIATIENDIYDKINDALGIDILIDSNSIILSSILRYVRKGKISAAYSLKGDIAEILEGDVFETSVISNKTVEEIFQDGIKVVYIKRDGKFLEISDDTTIQIGDNIAIFSLEDDITKAENLFITEK